jgi:hypothetical protein
MKTIQAIALGILAFLDWLIGLTERLLVLAIAMSVFYVGWNIFHTGNQEPLKDALQVLSADWKAVLILLIPLLYQQIKTILPKITKVAGIELEKEKPETETELDKGE